MRERSLIAAPYIRAMRTQLGTRVLRRMDPDAAGVAVCWTREVEQLLGSFRDGREIEQVLLAAPIATRESLRRQIETLEAARLLVSYPVEHAPRPSLELELTNRCNARCIMCPRDDLRPLGIMRPDVLEAVVQFVDGAGSTGCILQGIGEPTLYPGMVEAVSKLGRALGASKPLLMVTNGLLMTPALLEQLRHAGLSHLQWSFHALDPATYEHIMGAPIFARVKANLEACLREHADVISINMVTMDANAGEADAIRAWLTERGLPDSRLRNVRCFSRGGYVDITQLIRSYQPAATGRCLYVRKAIFIAWSGDLLPCSNDIRGDFAYGNLGHDCARELLNRWRDSLLSEVQEFEICRNCDHASRGSLDTGWYASVKGKPFAV